MNLLTKTIGSALVLATFAFSFNAEAAGRCGRRDNHDDGKVLGAIIGGVGGALLGDALGANTVGTIASGAGGAVVGSTIGDEIDDGNDCEDAYDRRSGRYTKSEIRRMERAEKNRLEREQRERRRDRNRYDREERYERYEREDYSRGGYNPELYQCQQSGYTAYGPNYVVVHLNSNTIVEYIGNDLNRCYSSAYYRNGNR